MDYECRCQRCGNTVYYGEDGLYIIYTLIFVNSMGLPQEAKIVAENDAQAMEKYKNRKKKVIASQGGVSSMRLIKKITDIKRTTNKSGKTVKIQKNEEYVQLA